MRLKTIVLFVLCCCMIDTVFSFQPAHDYSWYFTYVWDWDYVPAYRDNCPMDFNPTQRDTDSDGIGNACDKNDYDADWDGFVNENDNCPVKYNPSQRNTDNDTIGDLCDLKRTDLDWDGIRNTKDNCPYTYNPKQEDSNHNKRGDACECFKYFVIPSIPPYGYCA